MFARKPVPPFGGAVLCGGASRRMGEGTYNYVIWDDALVDIR